ncbi:MAG: metallophosphoesterase [Bosea sp. (in: a-proteobacteria)]
MFGRVDADRATCPDLRHVEILLGDLIDRGPDSSSVVEAAIHRQASHGLIALRGNHDQYLLDALTQPSTIPHWLIWGGQEALQSWGVDIRDTRSADSAAISCSLRDALPAEHLAFLAAMPLTWQEGELLCVHAGIRPGVPLEAQTASDLMMIREPFHSDERDHGFVVIHGHTPSDKPVIRTNRICVDTRAYNSGVLTCAVIERTTLRFISVEGKRGHWT